MSATKPPELAMLWEASDPHDALRQRFGFTDAEEACQWLGVVLAKHWGFRVNSCERLVISAGNALAWLTTDTHRLVAKWSVVPGLHPRLAELARLTGWLEGCGLPVAAPLPAIDGRRQVEIDGASLGLLPQVDGALLDVSEPTQVRAAGAVLAALHLALAEYPDVDRLTTLGALEPPAPMVARMTHGIESRNRDDPATGVDVLRQFLAARESDDVLPTQLIHNDIRSANVLYGGSRVAGVLDFEEATLDHCVVDIARGAVMLGTQYRSWGPVPPETHAAFVAGYQSVRPLSATEAAWLHPLMLLRTLQCVPRGADPAGWGSSAKHLAAAMR
ncbi:phosphotransferase [Actinopolymorpha sp. B11F2]|uniref:phosphotransferase enzyme family protein n=1 Tax=Actinopolymorpha sp. B11F2 TaxID=3160862 RepID=UPI0032E53025